MFNNYVMINNNTFFYILEGYRLMYLAEKLVLHMFHRRNSFEVFFIEGDIRNGYFQLCVVG